MVSYHMIIKTIFRVIVLLLFFLSTSLLMERSIFDVRGIVQIDPIPHTKALIKQERYVDANEYLTYFMQFDYVKANQEAHALLKQIDTIRSDIKYQSKKALEGLLEGISDEAIGNTSAIISDFFLFGDLRDLTLQGMNYYQGKEVDEVLVTLSAIGVVASATTYATAGTATPAKVGISSLKLARRTNKMPNWIPRYLKRAAPIMKETKSIKPVSKLLDHVSSISKRGNINQTLNIVSKTTDLKSLTKASKITTRFGKNSSTLLNLAGKNGINLISAISHSSKQAVLYASTFGTQGLKALAKIGPRKFALRMVKTSYKGNFDNLYTYLLKNVPSSLLIIIMLLGGFYFLNLIRKQLFS